MEIFSNSGSKGNTRTNNVMIALTVIMQSVLYGGQQGWIRNMLQMSKGSTGWDLQEQYAESQEVNTREMEFKIRLTTGGLRELVDNMQLIEQGVIEGTVVEITASAWIKDREASREQFKMDKAMGGYLDDEGHFREFEDSDNS